MSARIDYAAPFAQARWFDVLTRRAVCPELAPEVLLHAGPPFLGAPPAPVLNAAIQALLFEEMAANSSQAHRLIQRGGVELRPAQNYGIVTPLAQVVSASMLLIAVEQQPEVCYAPVVEGSAPALRFGSAAPECVQRLRDICRWLEVAVMPHVRRHPVAIDALIRIAIAAGEECHAETSVANEALVAGLTSLGADGAQRLREIPAFVLPILMAAAAAAMRTRRSSVVSIGGNGVDFGVRYRDEREWRRVRAESPRGVRFRGMASLTPLAAIGDSAVVDFCGLGGQAFSVSRSDSVDPETGIVDAARVSRSRLAPVINLGILDRDGAAGLIGRGHYSPPLELFSLAKRPGACHLARRNFGYTSGQMSSETAALPTTPQRAFVAFANRDFRIFFFAASAAMMADNIEHVISYYVIFQKFHSPALGAFAVVSHWVPYLLLAGYTGGLADRFDIRRLIQISMLMFMGVSVGWGIMFQTDSTEEWKAMVLLVIHGLAGVIWSPASQVLIHRIVAIDQLPSAVRLIATGRYLAFLLGPALGSAVLLAFVGPTYGIFINALIYVPMVVWLIKAPYGIESAPAASMQALSGFSDIWATMRVVAGNPILASMTVMIGASAFFVGNAYQAQMPGFAYDLGHGNPGTAYSLLLGADAAGGLAAGVLLESRGLLAPNTRVALILAMIWCVALAIFAQSSNYTLAIPMLFIAGFVELGFNSMAQSLVQLNAPSNIRGRVIGVFSMSASGLRTFSGLNVGLLGASIGIHRSLATSAGALFLVYVVLVVWRYARAASRPPQSLA